MNLTEVAMVAAITVSVAGVSYAVVNSHGLTGATVKVADQVSCRAVDDAIVAYAAQSGAAPVRMEQLRPYVKGDVSAYRIVGGRASGPGC
ncbi:hypothetical protein [Actinoplanes sp. NPDC049316]|uniref:hypothetical protein n=1 Tax=Actinoplanes sp. NPDC049316 TaxID=3154727 RepID=UPI003449A7EF